MCLSTRSEQKDFPGDEAAKGFGVWGLGCTGGQGKLAGGKLLSLSLLQNGLMWL